MHRNELRAPVQYSAFSWCALTSTLSSRSYCSDYCHRAASVLYLGHTVATVAHYCLPIAAHYVKQADSL